MCNDMIFLDLCRQMVRESIRTSASRPDTLFEKAFHDLREKVKEIKTSWEDQTAEKLEKTVYNDLQSKGIKVVDGKLSLGRYRGSGFVTSFKLFLQVEDEVKAEEIAEYLRAKFSPKWKLKEFENGIAKYNVR